MKLFERNIRIHEKHFTMPDAAESDPLYQELLTLRDSLVELSRTSIQAKESLSQSHQKLDNSVKKLTDQKKALAECRSDIKQLKKNGIDCQEMDELMEEINPTIQSLNQRTVPATGRLVRTHYRL